MSRYRIGNLLGQGGMALVHEAWRRLADDRQHAVVLKRLRPEHELHPQARARLDLEAAIGLSMAHPHVVQVFDYDRVGQDRCLVMERVHGLSLHALTRCVELPPPVVRLVLARVAMALAHVHDQGVLHRDLSPGNILISRAGEVKLADFGVARVLGAPATAPGFKGTPAYASPEAIRGHELAPDADLYSLAAVAYELIMGEPPHGRGDADELGRRQDPASGWTVAPVPEGVPMDLRALIQGLLAPVERRMLHTADEVLAVFDLYDQPVATDAELAALVERCMDREGDGPCAPDGERSAHRPGSRSYTLYGMTLILGIVISILYARNSLIQGALETGDTGARGTALRELPPEPPRDPGEVAPEPARVSPRVPAAAAEAQPAGAHRNPRRNAKRAAGARQASRLRRVGDPARVQQGRAQPVRGVGWFAGASAHQSGPERARGLGMASQ